MSDNLRDKMQNVVDFGEKNGWTRSDYANALRSIIADERNLLRSGKRRLNKNARSFAL